MKKALALLLALIMVLSLVACGNSDVPDDTKGQGGDPAASGDVTQEEITLKIMARTPSFYPNQNLGDVANMKAYEGISGVKVEWENYDPSVFDNSLAAAIAGDELPDIIMKGSLSNVKLYEWGQDEILIDLAPYLDEYAPNFTALMEQYPDIRKAITAPDGGIYGLPQVILAPQMRVPAKLFINTAALEQFGMDMPTTLDDLYEYMVAFRDSDFNGNGEADEIPLVASLGNLKKYFYGSFGLRTRGAHHSTVDVDPATGEVRLFATSDNYREFLEFLNKLYEEKLIYQEIFTDGDKSTGAFTSEDRVGCLVATTLYNVPTNKTADWAGVKTQLTGPDGYNIVSEVRSNLHSTGNFAITYKCENIERAIQWVDYFYSEEGSLFYHAGVEGEHWEAKADGSLGYTDACAATRTDNMTQDAFIAQFAMWPGGRNPSVMLDNLWGGEYEAEPAETALGMIEYASDVVWPFFSWTPDENNVMSTIGGDISSTISGAEAQAIAGEIEITDEWWESFKTELHNVGEDKLIETYITALERIYGNEAY